MQLNRSRQRVTGDLTVTGNLSLTGGSIISTSSGNLKLDPTDDLVTTAVAFTQDIASSLIQLAGGDAGAAGGNVMVFGQSHSSRPNEVLVRSGSTIEIRVDGNGVYMPSLPTADPTNADQLWNDSGTLKVSAG